MKSSLRVLCIALIGCWSLPAQAYERITSQFGVPLAWTQFPVQFNIHDNPGTSITKAETFAAVRAGYAAWIAPTCTSLTINDLGIVNNPQGNQNDGINSNVWLPGWPQDWQGALGVTLPLHIGQTGEIVDADTFYNPNVKWDTQGAFDAFDAQSVATHEIGHQFGLDHPPISAATMYFATPNGDTGARTLHSDDIAGICAIYPGGGPPPPPECDATNPCPQGETCQNNTCVPVAGGYGDTCNPQNPASCQSGLCASDGQRSVCTVSCNGGGPCPNNDQCVPVNGGQVTHICIPGDEVPPPPPPPDTKDLGEACTNSAECATKQCAPLGNAMVCISICQVGQPDACPAEFNCVEATGGKGACIPKSGKPIEPPPPPGQKGTGIPCTDRNECVGNVCIADEGDQYCSEACTDDSTCPAGFGCQAVGGQMLCVKPKGGGCTVGTGAGKSDSSNLERGLSLAWPMLVLAALLAGRRRDDD